MMNKILSEAVTAALFSRSDSAVDVIYLNGFGLRKSCHKIKNKRHSNKQTHFKKKC